MIGEAVILEAALILRSVQGEFLDDMPAIQSSRAYPSYPFCRTYLHAVTLIFFSR